MFWNWKGCKLILKDIMFEYFAAQTKKNENKFHPQINETSMHFLCLKKWYKQHKQLNANGSQLVNWNAKKLNKGKWTFRNAGKLINPFPPPTSLPTEQKSVMEGQKGRYIYIQWKYTYISFMGVFPKCIHHLYSIYTRCSLSKVTHTSNTYYASFFSCTFYA